MLLLAYATGLRRAELAAATTGDLSRKALDGALGRRLRAARVDGRSRRRREVPMPARRRSCCSGWSACSWPPWARRPPGMPSSGTRAWSKPRRAAALVHAGVLPMDPMTVNLQSDDEMHYVRIGITLKLTDPSAQDYLTQHMPEIRSRILMALSNKHPQDLATSDDKRQLVAQLRALIERPTQPGNRSARVDQVLITDFVLQ
ncbi:flagellar basal body-associated protein FliL [Burkholderia glumae]|uniref:flagellar basal body-associated protein FliL n=1 Tax=Burkholderia glumae TaxID=337 RepID=UPI003F555EC6